MRIIAILDYKRTASKSWFTIACKMFLIELINQNKKIHELWLSKPRIKIECVLEVYSVVWALVYEASQDGLRGKGEWALDCGFLQNLQVSLIH